MRGTVPRAAGQQWAVPCVRQKGGPHGGMRQMRQALSPAARRALAQGLINALGHPIVHPADARVRYRSSVLPGLAAAEEQTELRLNLLPWAAVVNASAIVTALWRMAVSHRDLLQWQTAEQRAEKRDGLGE